MRSHSVHLQQKPIGLISTTAQNGPLHLSGEKWRVAYVATHPIQYQAPLLRLLSEAGIDLHTFFLSDYSLHEHRDKGFNRTVQWDIPLTEGYSWEVLPCVGMGRSMAARPWWPISGLKARLASRHFDAVWVHGWGHIGLRQAVKAANALHIPVLLRGESIPRQPNAQRSLKLRLRNRFVRGLLQRVAACLCIGSLNRQFYREFGFSDERLFSMPYAVDNERFQTRCAEVAPLREMLRRTLKLEAGRPVILFAGKFVPVKAPEVLLAAVRHLFNTSHAPRPYLLLVGDGPMRPLLEEQAAALNGDVRFLGFKNQTELPAYYDLCDVFVLPSRFEPWGLVVNEAMNARKPVIVSDRVGAAPDLISPENGWIFESDDIARLAETLRAFCSTSPEKRAAMGNRSREIIDAWSFKEDLVGLLAALNHIVRPASHVVSGCV
jgi:glycosyltransferase involved in cell wall biosynthesis